MLSLQGPKSREILGNICDADLSNEAFPFSSHRLTNIAGHEVSTLSSRVISLLGHHNST